MSYQLVRSRGKEWYVDWDVIERLCMSYHMSNYQNLHSTIQDMSESKWYNPFSWPLPKIQTVDVDWDKVRSSASTACSGDMLRYSGKAANDMLDIARDVEAKVILTPALKAQFTDQMKAVQAENAEALEHSENVFQELIDGARFIRDTSADVIAVGAATATGGAALALMGASSALKGTGTYQDTGSVGAAVLQGGGSLVLGVYKLSGVGDGVLIIAQGVLQSGTSLVAGDSWAKAVEKGTLKIVSSGVAQALFSLPLVKTVFSRMPLPFTVFAKKSEELQVDVANDLVKGVTKKLTEKGLKAGIQKAVGAMEAQPGATSAPLIDEVPVLDRDRLLLSLAIVNSEKGIGRGW